MPAPEAKRFQCTGVRGGGPVESPDGKFVYYDKGSRHLDLWRVPSNGGEESQVLDSLLLTVAGSSWPRESISSRKPAQRVFLTFGFKDFATRLKFGNNRSRSQGHPFSGLTVSPDRRTLLYAQSTNPAAT